MIELFGFEETFKDHLIQLPAMDRDISPHMRLLEAPSNLTLYTSRDGTSTTSVGNLSMGIGSCELEHMHPHMLWQEEKDRVEKQTL